MLKIQCHDCGCELKGGEIVITPFYNYINEVKYKDYATTCSKCGGIVIYDRLVKKAEENKQKALEKMVRKKGKSIEQLTEQNSYKAIMREVYGEAQKIGQTYKANNIVSRRDFFKVFKTLPQDKKSVVVEYEDKENMKVFQKKCNKPIDHIPDTSVLLLTQEIVTLALIDKDEDFFKSQYGHAIVNMYNTALSIYEDMDYNITAEFCLGLLKNHEQLKEVLKKLKRTI